MLPALHRPQRSRDSSSRVPAEGRHTALRVALYYILFAALWFFSFGLLFQRFAELSGRQQHVRMAEASGFILLSALAIYVLIRREMRSRTHLSALLGQIVDLMPTPMTLRNLASGRFAHVNEAFAEQVGAPREEILARPISELGVEFDPEAWSEYERRLAREGEVCDFPLGFRRADGRRLSWMVSSRILRLRGDDYNLTIGKDVTELEAARAEAERRVRQLDGLRAIDRAISGSLDLGVTLDVILKQVTENLGADAAVLLVAESERGPLVHAACRGFCTQALRHTSLELGEGYAGRAARDRRTVRVDDLRQEPFGLPRHAHFVEEGFVSYVATPLVAAGSVAGVLEIFQRELFRPDDAWLDFLQSVAAQAAVALDKARLFDGLQRTHLELTRAYDRTIEGWSRALDLRDRITSGHTDRVAELTVRLARRLGMGGEALGHLRRGTLLHDIGKMGIPDSILHKTGPLDEQEWKIMRQHPVLAHRLLAPIEFLKPALDIPYCHHEKWDGTGYPRGLEGEEIPLAARIFAVVDVWDALRSDRPYRKAWSREKALAHIEAQAGSHFDPCVVEAFLELIEEGEREEREGEGEEEPAEEEAL